LVLLVGLAALIAAGFIGWSLAGRSDATANSPTASTSVSTSTSASCTPLRASSSATGPSGSTTALASRSASALPKPKTITVNVYNSTSTGGLARKTANALSSRGFTIGTVGNDSAPKPVLGVAEVRYGPKGQQQAIVVAANVHGAKLVLDKRKTTDVDVAVGAKFKHLATSAQVKAALSPSATATPSC
jgi:cytoskeletal protein RodZ